MIVPYLILLNCFSLKDTMATIPIPSPPKDYKSCIFPVEIIRGVIGPRTRVLTEHQKELETRYIYQIKSWASTVFGELLITQQLQRRRYRKAIGIIIDNMFRSLMLCHNQPHLSLPFPITVNGIFKRDETNNEPEDEEEEEVKAKKTCLYI